MHTGVYAGTYRWSGGDEMVETEGFEAWSVLRMLHRLLLYRVLSCTAAVDGSVRLGRSTRLARAGRARNVGRVRPAMAALVSCCTSATFSEPVGSYHAIDGDARRTKRSRIKPRYSIPYPTPLFLRPNPPITSSVPPSRPPSPALGFRALGAVGPARFKRWLRTSCAPGLFPERHGPGYAPSSS